MKTIIKIAWRNIWRNKLRSGVVIGSILLGIWAGIFVSSLSYGLNEQRTRNLIQNNLSHIQVHDTLWKKEHKLNYWLPEAQQVQEYLASNNEVQAFAPRIKVNAMIASARYTSGIEIQGIDPEREAALTGLADKVDSGSYFDEKGRNPVLIGKALAEKLKVKPGSKLILTFTDENGDIVAGAFKVKGFYKGTSSQIEKMQAFVRQGDILKLLDKKQGVHEYAMLLKNPDDLDGFKASMQKAFPSLLIQSWKDLSPELSFADELMTTMLYVIIGIIMLALCFGIVNTMHMAVLERRKELGMLMGVGMSKVRLFFMIMTETLMLSLCGGPLGILLGFITIRLTNRTGIDLGMWSRGLESYGIESVIYPNIDPQFYFGTGVMVMFVTLIAAIWPARRALKLNPVEAIRTI